MNSSLKNNKLLAYWAFDKIDANDFILNYSKISKITPNIKYYALRGRNH